MQFDHVETLALFELLQIGLIRKNITTDVQQRTSVIADCSLSPLEPVAIVEYNARAAIELGISRKRYTPV